MKHYSNRPALTDTQRVLAETLRPHLSDRIGFDPKTKQPIPRMVPMLTESAVFQPMQSRHNFKKGLVRDENGQPMKNGKGEVITEKALVAAYKEQYKNQLKKEYGDNWKKVFHNPAYAAKLS